MNLIKVISKSDVASATRDARELILSGEHNPLKLYIQLKAMEKVLKNLFSDEAISDEVQAEAEKHGKSFDFSGAKVQVKEAGTKYDYSVCNDEVYNDLLITEKQISEARKAREKMLQSGFNPETGEAFPKPIKSSKSTISITI